MSVNSPADKTLRMLSSSWITQNCRVSFGLLTHRLSETCIPLKQICGISSQAWANSVLSGRQIGLRADRDIEGDAGRDAARSGDRPARRDDGDHRSRRDDSYRSRRDDDRSYRRERSPRRDSYRDRGDDRHRRDDHRSERAPRQRESRGGKTAEELDAEMDALKEEVRFIRLLCAPFLLPVLWFAFACDKQSVADTVFVLNLRRESACSLRMHCVRNGDESLILPQVIDDTMADSVITACV